MVKPGEVKSSGEGLEAALRGLMTLDNVDVTAGVQGTAKTTADGHASPGELVLIATANEYGTDTIPPRPFMRTSVARHARGWVGRWDYAVLAATKNERPQVMRNLRLLGVQMVGNIQSTLNNGPWTPNAPATIARKTTSAGVGDQPLVDTGQLKQSIRAQVEVPGRSPVVVG